MESGNNYIEKNRHACELERATLTFFEMDFFSIMEKFVILLFLNKSLSKALKRS